MRRKDCIRICTLGAGRRPYGRQTRTAPRGIRRTGDSDRIVITDDVNEVVEVITTPTVNPEMFRRRVKSLTLSGLPRQEAEQFVASTPQKLELFYDIALGAFAIDAEAVGNTPLYNPYTGREIPDATES